MGAIPTPMDMFHLDLAPDLTPSPRVLMLPPRDMPPTTDTMARGLLMPRLTPVSSMDPALVLTPSPRALTLSPRELSPRGLLMLTPLSSMEPTDTLTPTPTPTPMFPLAPALVLTPSPRALT